MATKTPNKKHKTGTYYERVRAFEIKIIKTYLTRTKNIQRAADLLSLDRTTLSMRMKALGISEWYHNVRNS